MLKNPPNRVHGIWEIWNRQHPLGTIGGSRWDVPSLGYKYLREQKTPGEWAGEYPFFGTMPRMRSESDVISTLKQVTESLSQNSKESLQAREEAALAAEVLAAAVVYTLTMTTRQDWSEESYARLVTRHFEKFGINQKSLRLLLNIYELAQQHYSSAESR